MALKRDSLEKLRSYKLILTVFCCIAAVLPCLLGLTRFWTPLIALLLLLIPAYCRSNTQVRACGRVLDMLVLCAAPVLLLCIAVAGRPDSEYLSLLFFSTLPLPSLALATLQEQKADIVLMRVAAALHALFSVLLIYYIFPEGSYFNSLLYGGTAAAIVVLTVMIRPPVFGRKEKADGRS